MIENALNKNQNEVKIIQESDREHMKYQIQHLTEQVMAIQVNSIFELAIFTILKKMTKSQNCFANSVSTKKSTKLLLIDLLAYTSRPKVFLITISIMSMLTFNKTLYPIHLIEYEIATQISEKIVYLHVLSFTSRISDIFV